MTDCLKYLTEYPKYLNENLKWILKEVHCNVYM